MAEPSAAATIEAMRGFNRFYTGKLGLLGQAYLNSGFNLTEARILFDIAQDPGITAGQLARRLQLDPAYFSRILKRFSTAGLVALAPDPADRRSQRISLTPTGSAECDRLIALSRAEVGAMLAHLDAEALEALQRAFAAIEAKLDGPARSAADSPVLRPHRPGDLGWMVMSQTEFYCNTFQWDGRFEAMVSEIAARFLADNDPAREACWIAEYRSARVGSVLLVDGGDDIAKLRLLYIAPQARGLGLGKRLVERCIGFAREAGYRAITLWTNDTLAAARHIYESSGFKLVASEPHALFGRDEVGETWTLPLKDPV